jgi:hypothetical protein
MDICPKFEDKKMSVKFSAQSVDCQSRFLNVPVSVSFFLQSAMAQRGFVDAFFRRPEPTVFTAKVGRFADDWLRPLAVRREWLLGSIR